MGAIDTLPVASELEAIYIGYFGRAADAGGLSYWEQQYAADIASGHSVDQTLTLIANSFAVQAETVALYPQLAGGIGSLTTAQLTTLVDTIYSNLFGRTPAAGDTGVAYWVGQLSSGAVPLGQVIVAIANGATGTDQTVLDDRIAAANDFSAATAAAGIGLSGVSQIFVAEARNLVLSITPANLPATPGTVSPTVQNAINAFVANGGTALTIGPNLTFTLTVGQDTFTTGSGNDLYYAPLAGVFGNQATLTPFDKLVDSGNNNTLEAFFNAGAPAAAGLTIQGIQTWDVSNAISGTTTLTGVAFGLGGPGPAGGTANPGVQTINFQYSGNGGAQTLTIGSAFTGGGIQSLLTGTVAAPAVNVLNNLGSSTVNIFVGANQWTGVANSTLVVATNSGSTGFDIGPDVATTGAGYVNWIVQDQTAFQSGHTDTLTLGAQGNANGVAHTLTITGANGGAAAANITLLGDVAGAPAWSGLTSLTGNVNGFFTVTGAETTNGLLSGNTTALLSIVDQGTGASLFDLSSMTNANMHAMTAITGGALLGEVELNNSVITAAFTTPIVFTNIDDITDSTNSTVTGTIDMRNFSELVGGAATFPVEGATGSSAPSFSELQFLTASSATSGGTIGTLTVTNGLTDMFLQLNGQTDTSNLTISVGLSNLNGGINALAVGLDGQAIPTFTDNNYTTTDIVLGGSTTLGSTNFIDNQIIGDPLPGVVNISGTGSLILGNTVTPVEGTATVQINGIGVTAITDTATGNLTLGVTNAHSVTYSGGTGDLFMTAPGTDTSGDFTVTVTSEAITGSILDGSLGAVVLEGGNAIAGSPGNFSGPVGNDTITLGSEGDNAAGAGGADTINESAHTVFGNAIFFGGYQIANAAHASITGVDTFTSIGVGSEAITNFVIQEITNATDDAFQGFWGVANGAAPTLISSMFTGSNGGTSADMTTINGFTAGSGTAHDVLVFFSDAWTGGLGPNGALFDAGATVIHNTANSLAGTPTVGIVVPNDAVPPIVAGDNFIIDNFTTMNNAAQLALDLNTIFPITLPTGVTAGTNEHMLFAYQTPTGVNIADVDFISTAGTTTNTNAATMEVYASDIYHLAGVSLSSLTNANIHFA